MKLMVVGGGGREHALIKYLKADPRVTEIYALPGNGGIASIATCVPIDATDIPKIVDFAVEKAVDFAIVAPESPLVLGAVDALEGAGVPCFGPNAMAASIEGSKVFSKRLMAKYDIPTADYIVFDDYAAAMEYLPQADYPLVLKADGLALGKGVVICPDITAASSALHDIMAKHIFGQSGRQVVLEEFLTGPEVSVLTFTDGKTVVPMASSMDHKRVFDDDQGPNTGGMGAIAPNPYYTPQIARQCMEAIFLPTIRAMEREGRPFKGCLYFGLMLTDKGPKVIEYNCRFGDPETQVVLPLLKTSLLTVMQAVNKGTLGELKVEFSPGHCCCVVMASGGYPGSYQKGVPIDLGGLEGGDGDVCVFHAGTRLDEKGGLVTGGGRVLGVTATGATLEAAIDKAYGGAARIHFENAHYRGDIGKKCV